MSRGRSLIAVFSLLALIGTVGCGPDPKKQIADLQSEKERLQRDLEDKDKLLAAAGNREGDAQRSIDELNRQIAEMQGKMANQPKGAADAKGWIGMPGFDMISVPGEVLFDSGKCTLRASGKTALDGILSDIRGKFSDREIYVFGYTDNEPIKKSGWKDNWELGAQRALTVCRYMAAGGLDPRKLIQANCGENRPKASNASKDGKQKNRRVEFYAVVHRSGGPADATASKTPSE